MATGSILIYCMQYIACTHRPHMRHIIWGMQLLKIRVAGFTVLIHPHDSCVRQVMIICFTEEVGKMTATSLRLHNEQSWNLDWGERVQILEQMCEITFKDPDQAIPVHRSRLCTTCWFGSTREFPWMEGFLPAECNCPTPRAAQNCSLVFFLKCNIFRGILCHALLQWIEWLVDKDASGSPLTHQSSPIMAHWRD